LTCLKNIIKKKKKKKKRVETIEAPHNRRFYGKMELPPHLRRGGLWD
jgi:hypothetical protein